MDTPIAPAPRLFPRGTTTLALATAFAALGHFMALGCLYGFVTNTLGLTPDEGRVAWNLYTAATVIFYVVGGVWGDFGGHRRNMIIGPSITIAALFLLMITPDSSDVGAALMLVFAMSAFACGRSLFAVASGTLAAHLFEDGSGRVPLAGTYTMLHMAANTAILLLAPFAATSLDVFLGDGLGMSRDESQRLLFAMAAQPAICALIFGAVAKRTFAAAELAVRSKATARDDSPLEDGAVGYRRSALGLLVAACALGFAAYDNAMSGAFELAARLGGDGEWFGSLQLLNGAIVVFLSPVAVIVYGRMRRSNGRVPTAGVAVVGATLVGTGLTILLAVAAMMPESASEFAPPWLDDTPSVAWPILAQILVSLGEILFIPLMSSLFARLAPRRLRGLIIGVALAMTGATVLFTRLVGDAFDGIPLTASAAISLAAAIACAALLAVVGTVFRSRSTA
jgi:dipeptide/tripeptide permease